MPKVIKIITDSAADIPPKIAEELGISIVPLYVRFGNKTFKTGVEISNKEFYDRLVNGKDFPNTIQPSPNDFKETYEKLVGDADGIVSIHLSNKFSGTYQSAQQAAEMLKDRCPVEVINSDSMTIGLGMICIAAARAARDGASLEEVVKVANEAVPEIRFMVLFDSLKYLAKGGRIGLAKSLLGTILNIKPLLAMKDGVVIPAGGARSYSKAMDMQYEFLTKALSQKGNVKELAIMHNTTPDEANALIARIAPLYPREKIITGEIGPILGTHAGPNVIAAVVQAKNINF